MNEHILILRRCNFKGLLQQRPMILRSLLIAATPYYECMFVHCTMSHVTRKSYNQCATYINSVCNIHLCVQHTFMCATYIHSTLHVCSCIVQCVMSHTSRTFMCATYIYVCSIHTFYNK